MRENILTVLSRRTVVADGAMGSRLLARGVDPTACFDHLNLTGPELIRSVHREYLDVGAELIETNTFGANRRKLERFQLGGQVREINRQGAALARSCAGDAAWVAGSVGPLGRLAAGELKPEEIRTIFAEQAEALAAGGADLILLETFADPDLLLLALEAVRSATGLPTAAQMVFGGAGQALGGRSPGDCLRLLRQAGADIVGLNCGLGPKGARDILAQAGDLGGAVSVFPNAGFPEHLGDRLIYPSSPEYFADMLRQCADNGARLLGGCCGTGPEHIRALRAGLSGQSAGAAPVSKPAPGPASGPSAVASGTPPRIPGAFARDLGHRPMILVELDPPKHLDLSQVLEAADGLAAAGVDAITLAENPLATPRLSNIALAGMIRDRTGADVLVHLTGRDRNLIGMQSTIMGLAAMGLTNVLAVTGDPPSSGGEEQVTGVFDVRSYELIALLDSFRQGRNAQGQDMRLRPEFRIGAAFNPNTRNIGLQVGRLRRKIELGCDYVLTQPVYSRAKVDEVIAATKDIGRPVFLGIMPLASSRNAEFLHNEFPGISIPDAVRARMRGAGDNGAAEGLEIAWELMAYALPHFAGIYIMPPFNRYKVALELMRRARDVRSS